MSVFRQKGVWRQDILFCQWTGDILCCQLDASPVIKPYRVNLALVVNAYLAVLGTSYDSSANLVDVKQCVGIYPVAFRIFDEHANAFYVSPFYLLLLDS